MSEPRTFTFTLETLEELLWNTWQDSQDLDKPFDEYWANILELIS